MIVVVLIRVGISLLSDVAIMEKMKKKIKKMKNMERVQVLTTAPNKSTIRSKSTALK